MVAPSSLKAVEDIWSVLTDGHNVWSTKKINKNKTQLKKIEFVFVMNEK